MAKKFAMVFGWIFVVLGVLGFFSNPIVGKAVGAWFAANTAHSVWHLVVGIVLLWVAYGMAEKAAMVLRVLGLIFVLIAIIGFFSSGSVLGLIDANTADNWVTLVVGLLFLWGGMSKSGMQQPSAPMGGQQM
ncbi:DUF4383 domain-containing protein [Candidatus Parcubacteria bacterium]|nr:DUF4383 domain-containing protein [Candidatus Parcubacteria bacterium]